MKKLFIPPVLVLFSLILVIVFYFLLPELNVVPFPINLTGLIIAFAGFSIMGKARDLFKKYKTTLDFETSAHLIDESIFSKSRNPMYAGMFLLLLGIAVCFGNIISVCVPFVFILVVRIFFIPLEERIMEKPLEKNILIIRAKQERGCKENFVLSGI